MQNRQELIEAVIAATAKQAGYMLPELSAERIGRVLKGIESLGLAIVPTVATEEMLVAGNGGFVSHDTDIRDLIHPDELANAYTAMIAPSPFTKPA